MTSNHMREALVMFIMVQLTAVDLHKRSLVKTIRMLLRYNYHDIATLITYPGRDFLEHPHPF